MNREIPVGLWRRCWRTVPAHREIGIVGRDGDIQVSRGSAIAEELERAIDREHRITVVET